MITEDTLDHLAFKFKAADVQQMPIETLAEIADVDLFEADRNFLRNAMMMRGVLIKDGMASIYDGHQFKSLFSLSFTKFVERAVPIIEASERPIMPVELIGRLGLSEAATPLSNMSEHLKRAGITYIPGVGYWHKRHYVDQHGSLFGAVTGNKQAAAMFEAFREYGWPLTIVDIVAVTGGEVTSRYVLEAVKRPWPDIVSVGRGLYVPAGAARRVGFPMSKNVAQAFLDLSPNDLLDSRDNMRMYRLATLLQKFKFGIARKSAIVRDDINRRVAYFKLNRAGRDALNAMLANKKSEDEF